jgi:hypothetical protein
MAAKRIKDKTGIAVTYQEMISEDAENPLPLAV